MSFLSRFKDDAEGIALLKDWLGDGGKIVPPNKSIGRAEACVNHEGKPCPENVEPGWWDRFKMKVAEIIRKQLELKSRLGIKVPQEKDLAMCRVCGCCLPLKVHVPIEYIAEHTNVKVREKFPPWCWIKKELEEYEQFHNSSPRPSND